MPTKTIKSQGNLTRSFVLKREAVHEEERTVELAFSSETEEVERWFGVEILDHSPSSVRLERLRNGGPLLFLHDWNQHLGVIEDVSIEKRRGKAVVRFGRSALAEEKFQDVKDGVLVHVSIGYRVLKLILETRVEDGPDVYRAIDWEPYEISLLPVAADVNVGVGRAAGDEYEILVEDNTMPDKDKGGAQETQTRAATTQTAAPVVQEPETRQVNVQEIQDQVRSAELQRINDIETMGGRYRSYGGEDLAREYIKTGKTVEEFRAAILENLPDQDNAGSGERAAPSLDLSTRDLSNYSLIRAINAMVAYQKGDVKALRNAAFEMECSDEISERLDREARGFFVPLDVVTRAMTASSNSDLIATEHMANMFIDTLRPNSVVMQLGATVMDGLQGDVDIPKALGNPNFQWIGDDDDGPDNDIPTGSILMKPHTLAGGVPMSRRLLKQSSPSVERVIQNALLKGAALGIDLGILMGTGSNNQPMGITNATGVNVQAVATPGKPTWNELVGFETKVNSDNALTGKLAYVTTAGVRGNLKTTPKDAGSGLFLMNDKDANGYGVSISNQLDANRMIFGNWEDVMVGLWGVLDIMPDKSTKAKSGGLVLRVFQDADVGIGHPESFCING